MVRIHPCQFFILRPWPNWFKALTFRVSDCGFESHWAYCHQCVGIEGYEDNDLSSSGCLGSESPKGNRSDTVIGMYSWKTFPWILFVLGQMKPTLSKQWFELHLGIGLLKRTSLQCKHGIFMGKYLTIRQPLKRAMSLCESKWNLSLNQGYGKRLSGRLLYFRVMKLVELTIREVSPAKQSNLSG